ncbi:hypothetical protein TMEN_4576 [Trichophyton mentagrophytes]|nr:hypothetical protein TMEN_4576 [Trichophyton mentagrophytes]
MSYANFEGLERETARLIVQAQLEDLQDIKQCSKGKGREGELSDADLTVELYDFELVRFAVTRVKYKTVSEMKVEHIRTANLHVV